MSKMENEPVVNNADNKELYFGGIEGGATKTTMVIINCDRKILAESAIGPTNPWLLGFEKSADLLIQLIEQTKAKANNVKLEAIGMSLSGAGQQESKQQLYAALKPKIAVDNIFIEEDIMAPVFALSAQGGINMICGTGSNCVIYNKDGSSKKVGGWGHLLGDEAGAYWIAQRAIKSLFDHYDNFRPMKCNPEVVKRSLLEYMDKSNLEDILDKFYRDFSKDFIAGFAKKLAKLADDGDALALKVFRDAGFEIGRHILAIQTAIEPSMLKNNGNLLVICTGGVFESWKYLKSGFKEAILKGRKTFRSTMLRMLTRSNNFEDNAPSLNPAIKEISFVRLLIPAAVGAAVWAAGKSKVSVADANQNDIIKIIDTISI